MLVVLEAQTHLPPLFSAVDNRSDPSGAQSLSSIYSLRQTAAAAAHLAAVLLLYLHPHVVQQDFNTDVYTTQVFKQDGIVQDILDRRVTLWSCKAA